MIRAVSDTPVSSARSKKSTGDMFTFLTIGSAEERSKFQPLDDMKCFFLLEYRYVRTQVIGKRDRVNDRQADLTD